MSSWFFHSSSFYFENPKTRELKVAFEPKKWDFSIQNYMKFLESSQCPCNWLLIDSATFLGVFCKFLRFHLLFLRIVFVLLFFYSISYDGRVP